MNWPSTIARARSTWSYRHEPEMYRILARVYWTLLLIIAALLIVWAVAYSTRAFFAARAAENGELSLSGGGGAAPLNRADLDAIIEHFAERQARYESLKNAAIPIADPSR